MKIFVLPVLLLITLFSFAQSDEVDVPEYPALKQRFYSTSEGKESNDGLTEKTPKVLPDFLWEDFKSSYHIRLKRGDVFPQAIIGDKNFNTRQIVISPYGKGAKPVLDLFKTAKNWTKHSFNIWKISLATNSTDYTGYRHLDNKQNVNVGFLKVGNVIHGDRVNSQSDLTQQWQFYCANSTLYIYSKTQPAANAVRFSACHAGVTLSQNMHVYNIKVLGAGDHGFNGDKQNQVLKNIKVKGCEAVDIGGCILTGYGDGTTRYGNGFQLYKGGEDCEFINNYAEQCFDVAYTLQSNYAVWRNIIFDGNKSKNCNQDIELWTDKSIFYTNVRFRNGEHTGAGYCWGNPYRRQEKNDPDNKVGVSVLMYGGSKIGAGDCIIENNEFAGARDGYITWTANGGHITTKNNKVTLALGQSITSAAYGQVNNTTWINTPEGVEAFKAATGKDAGTIFNSGNSTITPVAPTLAADDEDNTLTASHALGSSEIMVSVNNGIYKEYTGQINVGNVARVAGYWKFKIKAASLRNESPVINSPAFTAITTTPDAPTLEADDEENTLTASHPLGSSEILVSENNEAYEAYTGKINVGKVTRAAGYWKFKIKAATQRNESTVISSPSFTVTTTPATPTLEADDEQNTLTASHPLGNSEILVSENDATYEEYTGKIKVGNVARAPGYWKFKIKAATGRNESSVVKSPEFTVTTSSTPVAPTLEADNEKNTLTASHPLGSSEIVVSENNEPYEAYKGQIKVGNVARPAGYWKFKIKAATGRNESSTVSSPAFKLAAQTISFPSISVVVLGVAPFTLSATASSGLPVSYKVISGPATVSGAIVTVTDEGTVVIEASQPGNANFNPAATVRRTFTVNPSTVTTTCSATGSILLERWNNINGVDVEDIPLQTTPSITTQVNELEYKNTGYVYGVRIRGYICPPITGNYTFWISGDESAELLLSTDDDPENKEKIAYLTDYTDFRDWTEYSTQKSVKINLKANKKYYIEVLHKQNGQDDHLSVSWKLPNGVTEAPIGGSRLSPYTPIVLANQTINFSSIPEVTLGVAPFKLSATASSDLPVTYKVVSGPATVSDDKITVTDIGTVVIEANQSGNAGFYAATPVRHRFTVNQAIDADAATCSATGSILFERWDQINGIDVTDIPLQTNPSITKQVNELEYNGIGYTYGVRIRGYICPPQSGDYTFWIAGDDAAELWVSTDQEPANKKKIAYLTSYTDYRDWSKYGTQKSVKINLKANKKYYIEILHKQNGQDDHLSVSWKLPNGVKETPINGSHLSPYIANNAASRALPQNLIVTTDTVEEKDLIDLKVYPNPVKDVSTIEVNFGQSEPQHVKLEVFDLYGKLITTLFDGITEKVSQKRFKFQADKLAAGVYFIRATGDKISLNHKIIVVR